MTTIQDTLTYIDGSTANGRLVVAWKPFTVGNVNAAGGELEWGIVDGVVSVSLYSNVAALPAGSYYIAKYELENGAVYLEYWQVPNLPTVNLGQVRVSFPPSPSVMISPLQLSSLNAQPGMFLMWDGQRWVPGYPSSFNLNPNFILVAAGTSGSDVNITGSPVSLGNSVTINVPDAGPAARGVVTTGAQSFAGPKTFLGPVTVPNLTAGNITVSGGITGPAGSYMVDPTISQGDLIVRGAAAPPTRLAAGTNGQVLTVDSTLPVGVKWAPATGGGAADLEYLGGYIPGTYNDGDIVVASDGIAYMCVKAGVTTPPDPWPGVGIGIAGPPGPQGPPLGIQDEGALLTLRSYLDFVGPGVTATDDAANNRTIVTIPGGGAVISVFTRTGAVVALAADYSAFYPPIARQVIAGAGMSGGGDLSADRTLTAKVFLASGASHAIGAVPDPGVSAGTTRYLREDATWAAPPGGVPTTRQIIAGTGLTGGGDLSVDRTLAAIAMGASGAGHAAGIVPDPGATLGSTRYLREDATWAVPAGAGGGLTDPTTTKGDLMVRSASAVTRLGVATDGWVLTLDSVQTLGVKWAAAAAGGFQLEVLT